jgi:glycosyltransferase involved in cell wall biosynthesis
MGPTVSVIIPTYNRAHLLPQGLESALAQTFSPAEIIVVDDGSTDSTHAVVDAYVNANASRSCGIRYFVQQQKGPSAARNRGIAEARGEWIAFLDSDDLWHPRKLEAQFQALAHYQGKFGVCYTQVRFVNNSSIDAHAPSPPNSNGVEAVVLANPPRFIAGPDRPIFVQSILARTSLVRAAGGFDENLYLGEDHDFAFRLGLATGFCFVSAPMVDIDRNPARAVGMIEMWDQDAIRLEQRQLRYEKWLRLCGGNDPELKKILTKTLTDIHSEWANLFLAKGDYGQAFRSIDKAVSYRGKAQTLGKWLLIHLSPQLVRRMVVWRRQAAISMSRN